MEEIYSEVLNWKQEEWSYDPGITIIVVLMYADCCQQYDIV